MNKTNKLVKTTALILGGGLAGILAGEIFSTLFREIGVGLTLLMIFLTAGVVGVIEGWFLKKQKKELENGD